MAHFAILNENNLVTTIVAADTIDGVKQIFPSHKIVCSTQDNPAREGATYDEKTEKFILVEAIDELAPKALAPKEVQTTIE